MTKHLSHRGRPQSIVRAVPDRSLPDRIRMIGDYHREAMARAGEAAAAAVLCGYELAAARSQVQHGEWEHWVEMNCPFTATTAWRYMQAAERHRASNPNLAHVQDLRLGNALLTTGNADFVASVRGAFDGQTLRQMYLDLGILRAPEDRRLGGDRGGGKAKAEKYKNRHQLRAELAAADWTEIVTRLRQFVLVERRHSHLPPQEIAQAIALIKDVVRALQESSHA